MTLFFVPFRTNVTLDEGLTVCSVGFPVVSLSDVVGTVKDAAPVFPSDGVVVA